MTLTDPGDGHFEVIENLRLVPIFGIKDQNTILRL